MRTNQGSACAWSLPRVLYKETGFSPQVPHQLLQALHLIPQDCLIHFSSFFPDDLSKKQKQIPKSRSLPEFYSASFRKGSRPLCSCKGGQRKHASEAAAHHGSAPSHTLACPHARHCCQPSSRMAAGQTGLSHKHQSPVITNGKVHSTQTLLPRSLPNILNRTKGTITSARLEGATRQAEAMEVSD